jgi:hypothetical protein
MYVEIKTDDIPELRKGFESALANMQEGQHARLTLEKDGEFYTLSVANNLSVCPGCEICGSSTSVTDGLSDGEQPSPECM